METSCKSRIDMKIIIPLASNDKDFEDKYGKIKHLCNVGPKTMVENFVNNSKLLPLRNVSKFSGLDNYLLIKCFNANIKQKIIFIIWIFENFKFHCTEEIKMFLKNI